MGAAVPGAPGAGVIRGYAEQPSPRPGGLLRRQHGLVAGGVHGPGDLRPGRVLARASDHRRGVPARCAVTPVAIRRRERLARYGWGTGPAMTQFRPPSDGLAGTAQRWLGRPVLVVGDVMLDEWRFTEPHRLSREAPAPVVTLRPAGGRGRRRRQHRGQPRRARCPADAGRPARRRPGRRAGQGHARRGRGDRPHRVVRVSPPTKRRVLWRSTRSCSARRSGPVRSRRRPPPTTSSPSWSGCWPTARHRCWRSVTLRAGRAGRAGPRLAARPPGRVRAGRARRPRAGPVGPPVGPGHRHPELRRGPAAARRRRRAGGRPGLGGGVRRAGAAAGDRRPDRRRHPRRLRRGTC